MLAALTPSYGPHDLGFCPSSLFLQATSYPPITLLLFISPSGSPKVSEVKGLGAAAYGHGWKHEDLGSYYIRPPWVWVQVFHLLAV